MTCKSKLSLSVVAIAIAGFATPVFAETFRLAHHHAVGGRIDIAATHFADMVAERSNGAVEILVFPGAQLGQEREAFDLVNQGAIDISITTAPILERVFPPMAVTAAPMLFIDWDFARENFRGEFGDELRAGVRESSDVEILGFFHAGFRDLMFTDDAPTTLAQIRGMRMRSPENFVWVRMFELLGTRPTPVTWGEVYTAMQTGVAEGLDTSAASAIDMNFDEVTSSLLRTRHMFSTMVFAMNGTRYESLPPETQELLTQAAWDTGDYIDLEVAIPAEEAAYATLESLGVTIVDPENPQEWRDAITPLLQEIAEKAPGSDRFIEMLRDAQR